MTIVMTIDIGIKNLAICIAEKINCTYNILFWKVFNTMLPEESENLCCGKFKNGNNCTRKCSMKNNIGNFYCKTHSTGGSKKIKPNKKVNTMSYTDIATGILYATESMFQDNTELMNKIDKIYIELQLVKNPRMKFTSHVIMTKLIDIYRLQSKTIPITFMRASMKLKLKYTGPDIIYKVKNLYSRRKKCAIEYTRHFLDKLETDKKWLLFFNNQKIKLDDYADTYLMCLIVLGYPRK